MQNPGEETVPGYPFWGGTGLGDFHNVQSIVRVRNKSDSDFGRSSPDVLLDNSLVRRRSKFRLQDTIHI
jgi:hypothetical protein